MGDVLELYELQFSDLLLLSTNLKPANLDEVKRLKIISEGIMQNLGPTGPGLLSISGLPRVGNFRRILLPLARKLALIDNDDRKRILKEHNIGSDVALKNLDRIVSSFALQMKYDEQLDVKVKSGEVVSDGEFKDLGLAFRELGFRMMELGLCLARFCDKMIGGHELEHSLFQCGTAKGRLIHYHSFADNLFIKGASKGRGGNVNLRDIVRPDTDDRSDLWQQWHYDYGIFTILTAPTFYLSSGNDEQECESPSDHTFLQVFHPNMNRVLKVKASKESCIVQVGESADVLSNGKLQATLHSVCRPAEMYNLSRETFVVFLQPAWTKKFSLFNYPMERWTSSSDRCPEEMPEAQQESSAFTQKIIEIIPPLCKRLQNGMTFAEFSRETTKQYYGGGGLQSNK